MGGSNVNSVGLWKTGVRSGHSGQF
jgi:hypothetical protein